MEDFYFAGGLPALLAQLKDILHGDSMTVTGKTLVQNIASAQIFNNEVIRTRENALSEEGGTAVLHGNLAPQGAVIKHAAMEPRFLKHTGPAVVFKDYEELAAKLDDPSLEVTADSVLVLQNAGPVGGPGMPEWGMLPIPKKLLQAGIRDMLRISDARMSGTSYGACVLHVAPESAVGGPLAFVRDGDLITLDVAERKLTLEVSEAELKERKDKWKPAPTQFARGYLSLFLREVTQANEGCDLRFLGSAAETPEPKIH
jgi:dihydroxy-acid dehydratase